MDNALDTLAVAAVVLLVAGAGWAHCYVTRVVMRYGRGVHGRLVRRHNHYTMDFTCLGCGDELKGPQERAKWTGWVQWHMNCGRHRG